MLGRRTFDDGRSLVRDRFWKRLSVLGLAVVLCGNSLLSSCGAGELQWAVLADPEVERAGLADLLTVELSPVVQLVERAALREVLAEIELSKFGAPDGVGLRLRVGPKFKADRLIVLTLEPSAQKTPHLKLVICETRQGTRLSIARRAWPPDDVQVLARDLAQVAGEVRSRFPEGVQQIVGVGPFLSQNLLHNYDFLQHSLPTLVTERLLEYPGVAVLELDEYRALGDELRLHATKLEERVVPLLVEGEFALTEQGVSVAPSEARLNLSLTTSGAEERVWQQSRRSLSEVADWLREQLPRELLKSASRPQRGLSVDEQFAALTLRADTFASIGLWAEAIALRESALLLKDDLTQQLRLLGDYHLLVSAIHDRNRIDRGVWLEARKRTREEVEQHSRELDDELLPLLERYSQLVTDRLAARDLTMLEGGVLWSAAFNRTTNVNSPEGFRRVHELRRGMFWSCIPHLRSLDPSPRRGGVLPEILYPYGWSQASLQNPIGGPSLKWTSTAMGYADAQESRNTFLRRPFSSDRMFDDIERFLREASPWPVPGFIRQVFPRDSLRSHSGNFDQLCDRRPVTREEFTRFYERLAKSDEPLMKFYGRVGLLGRRLKPEMNEPQRSLNQSLLDEFESVRLDLFEYCRRNPETWDAGEFADSLFDEALGIITLGRNRYLIEYALRRDRIPLVPVDRKKTVPVQEMAASATIRFVPLPEHRATWDALVPCGPSLDAVFTDFDLWLMPRPGVLQSILQTDVRKRDYIQKVHWDGSWIWVTTRMSGLRVFTPAGELVGHLPVMSGLKDDNVSLPDGTQTLPPVNPESMRPSSYRPDFAHGPAVDYPAFRICPLGDGRCLAVGQFGPGQRSWICSLKLDRSGQWAVKLVHQGVKIAKMHYTLAPDDLSYAFRPGYVVPFELPGREAKRAVVIGRGSGRATPLVYDPESEQVSLWTLSFQSYSQGFTPIPIINGQLVYRPFHVYEAIPSSANAGRRADGSWRWAAPQSQLVPTIASWYRLHSNPLRVEKLEFAESRVDVPYVLFATSSHFGPIVWRPDGRIERVVVEASRAHQSGAQR